MQAYTIRLFTDQARQVICTRHTGWWADAQEALARAVADYIQGTGCQDTMQADISTGRRHAHYIIQFRNNCMIMYRRVGSFALDGNNVHGMQAPRYHEVRPHAGLQARHEGEPT